MLKAFKSILPGRARFDLQVAWGLPGHSNALSIRVYPGGAVSLNRARGGERGDLLHRRSLRAGLFQKFDTNRPNIACISVVLSYT